jgi:membrane protein YqaA with SNARE-associated domain
MSTRSRTALVIIATLAVPLVPFVAIGELPGERWLSATDHNAFTFALLGSGLLAADVLLPVPSSVLGALLGARLGFALGFVGTFAGLALGHLLGYAVGRLVLTRAGAELPVSPTLLAVFASRPVPVLAEAITLTAGAARTPFVPFVLAVLAGDALYAAALAATGAEWLSGTFAGVGLVLSITIPAAAWLAWRGLRTKNRQPVARESRG